jgi:glycosyltransferase involved in cell wall biosynthesis
VDGFASAFGRLRVTAAAVERLTGVPARQRLGEAGLWLFASDTLRRRALDAGWRLPRVAVAHPGVDLDLFGEAPPRPWGWRLLYCGRIDPRKGIDTAIEALEHLPAEARLTVVGGGDERHLRELRELVAARSLERRVRFLRPPRGELPSCYAEADVTVFPVRWVEPFGLVPLESMAVGTPVVATGLGGSAEYLRDRANCLLYDVEGGPPALARAVLELARDEELRARVRRQGLATAARFDERSFNEAVEAEVRAAAG